MDYLQKFRKMTNESRNSAMFAKNKCTNVTVPLCKIQSVDAARGMRIKMA